jgi:hypothetical protein
VALGIPAPEAAKLLARCRWRARCGAAGGRCGTVGVADARKVVAAPMTEAGPDAISPDGMVRLCCFLPLVRLAAGATIYSAVMVKCRHGRCGQTVTQHDDTAGFFI